MHSEEENAYIYQSLPGATVREERKRNHQNIWENNMKIWAERK